MSARVETTFRGDTAQLERRISMREKLTPAYFALERERIFRRAWLPIGHASHVPEPGSYFVRELPVLKTSLLVVRGQDGKVRAFHNACTHRGNKLVRGGDGCRKSFSCGFHGWTFSSEGDLRLVTDEHQFRDLDKGALGLRPIHTQVWEDLVFVNGAAEPRESLREWLGEMFDEYGGYFDQHERVASLRINVHSNWNLAVNSFTEGYHTLYLHRNSVPDYQGERIIPAFGGEMPALPPGVNPSRYEYWAFDVVQFYPNAVFLFGNNWHIEIFFGPIDVDHTEVVQDLYYYRPRNAGERLSHQFFLSRGRQVFLEDMNTLEAQHAVLSSGVLSHLQLSQQEMSL